MEGYVILKRKKKTTSGTDSEKFFNIEKQALYITVCTLCYHKDYVCIFLRMHRLSLERNIIPLTGGQLASWEMGVVVIPLSTLPRYLT